MLALILGLSKGIVNLRVPVPSLLILGLSKGIVNLRVPVPSLFSLRNISDSIVLKCIVVGQRLDHDVGDYPKLNKRIYRHKNMPWNLVDIDKIDEPNAGKK
ncbi:hypothetical protein [Neptuniibacter marinus]|uniref:hypothetical protein n=1 Tax=Neptuniibacter marinus TaxID=1806670 RepID=UPI003B5B6414